jgi:small subunit ribosomal protein S12
MPTYNQYLKKTRKLKKKKTFTPALQANPQKKGICTRVYITTPKKPNSAQRKVARVRLRNKYHVLCYIPGKGHNLQRFSTVLVRGGRVRDLPGVKYKIIRGKCDTIRVAFLSNKRSKYGTRRRRLSKGRTRTFY